VADLRPVLAPQSIALIGASSRPNSFGARVLANLAGYSGRLHLVNPRQQSIGDLPCHAAIAALPERPDLAVIAVPREAVEPLVLECADAGIPGVIVFASGYAETGKPERVAAQLRLAAIARARGIRIIGPNTIGLLNVGLRAGVTFSGMPDLPPLLAHAVGVVSQSGALGFALSQAIERGVPLSHVLTSGNSCDVDVADYVAYLAEDPSCAAIACLFEGMADPRRMVAAAELAWRADKPLVVHKIATGEEGARAAMSHTGSLAGSDAAYAAALDRVGVVRVDRLEALIETAAFLAKAPRRPPAPGVAVVATSGGAAIMAADKAELHGVTLPQPEPGTSEVLRARIPEYGSARNPCDVTAQVITDPDSLRECAGALLADANYGALVVPQVFAYATASARFPMLSALAKQNGKVVCNVWLTEWEGPGVRESEQDPHIALFRSMDRCFAAIAAWHRRAALRDTPAADGRLSPAEAAATAAALIRAAPARVMTEREAKAVLAAYGVTVIGERLATETEDAVGAAATLGYPVALKVESPDIPHKTEAGVIRLDLRSADQVRAAFAALLARADAIEPPPRVHGVLVQKMAPPGLEVMVGARIDRLFGPLIVVGLGGVLVELLADTAVAPAPVTREQAVAMLRGLKGARLLAGYRGGPAVDVDALAEVVARLSELVADQAGLIEEMDVNPLICAGDGIVAVDALLVRRGGEDALAETPEVPGGGVG
jgi:acetyl-CoA synthetase